MVIMRIECLLFASSLMMATEALAGQCPSLMEQIDKAIDPYDQENELNQKEIKGHRTAGEIAHFAGDHNRATDELRQALKLIGMRS
jgi:hypothetical protein